MNCTRCNGTGFLNDGYIPFDVKDKGLDAMARWCRENETDAAVCDCCGDGEGWHGEAGQHYVGGDHKGLGGPYAYNGGLAECH